MDKVTSRLRPKDIQHAAGGIPEDRGIPEPLGTLFSDAENMGRHGEQILYLLPFHRKIKADGDGFQPLEAGKLRNGILFLKGQGVVIYPS